MATKTWNQTSGNLASTDANWVGGVKPIAGDNIVLDGTSTANMTQDLALTFGSFSMLTGYTGTVTQTVDFGCTDLTLSAGLYSGNWAKVLTVSGTVIEGVYTNWGTMNICLTGEGKTHVFHGSSVNYKIRVSGACTLQSAFAFVWIIDNTIVTVSAGGSGGIRWFADYPGSSWSNSGTINGPGALIWRFSSAGGSADNTVASGTINAPLTIDAAGSSTASHILTLTAALILGSTLSVNSSHATYTMTLDLSASNYPLTATIITEGTRGIINGRASRIVCTTYTQDGASSVFTQGGFLIVEGTATVSNGTWAVNENATVDALAQSGGTITVAAGKVLYYEKTLSQTGGSSSGTIAQFQARKQPPIQPAVSRPVDVTNL